jgi:WD40 repeat protein
MAPPTKVKRRLSDEGATSSEGSAPEDARTPSTSALALAASEAESRLAKRSRVSDIVPVSAEVVTAKRMDERTSGLAAPTMLLTGHSAAVNSLKFDLSGQHVVSSSFDRSIRAYSGSYSRLCVWYMLINVGSYAVLWDVYGECRNYNVLSGHKNSVLEVHWTYDSQQIVSASADKTVGVWDAKVSLLLQ